MCKSMCKSGSYFNPRPPCGRRPASALPAARTFPNFNPRPPCGRRLAALHKILMQVAISTHVPRAGDDDIHSLTRFEPLISTHVPRAGDDQQCQVQYLVLRQFQPTSPVRETTGAQAHLYVGRKHFNPRPPCGRRLCPVTQDGRLSQFQPTSPVRETTRRAKHMVVQLIFQPTSPVRETTDCYMCRDCIVKISTHVPRAGDDRLKSDNPAALSGFQPTSPVRETTGRGGGVAGGH